jgi:hypothetical protein
VAARLIVDTEQVAAQWQHSVAFGVALGMLHWEMQSVLPRHTATAIKIASRGGALFPIINLGS